MSWLTLHTSQVEFLIPPAAGINLLLPELLGSIMTTLHLAQGKNQGITLGTWLPSSPYMQPTGT